ncbi:ribonuclease HII [Eggerthellaceae bacterium 3-80]|nr:ribonuclease HII [bacterium D16-34]
MDLSVGEIKHMLSQATEQDFAVFERSLAADTRKGVQAALRQNRKRLDAQAQERARLKGMYDFEQAILDEHAAGICVGLDEVGRGSLAGPLAVGAVVLPKGLYIDGLNDSKQVKPADREVIVDEIKKHALAWTVQYIEPEDIDACGMSASLRVAFTRAVKAIEEAGITPDVVLLDGNPQHLDPREVNIIKGDGKCASIAAASLVAKVERDALMVELAHEYPKYDWAACKGYASPAHIEAIKQHGLTPLHRVSFCGAFTQPSLF